jgi:hypothetical protein
MNVLTCTIAMSPKSSSLRYRSGGEQTMRVEHVTVNEGGQSIVGNVLHGAGSNKTEPTS